MTNKVIDLCDFDSDSDDDSLLGFNHHRRFQPAHDGHHDGTTIIDKHENAIILERKVSSPRKPEPLQENSSVNLMMVDPPVNSYSEEDDINSKEFRHVPICKMTSCQKVASNDDSVDNSPNQEYSKDPNNCDDDCSIIEILDETLDESMHYLYATFDSQKTSTDTSLSTKNISSAKDNSVTSTISKRYEGGLKNDKANRLDRDDKKKNETDTDCIILLSSDDEFETHCKPKNKGYSASNRFQDSNNSFSDDDELPSPTPFKSSFNHRSKGGLLISISSYDQRRKFEEAQDSNSPIEVGAKALKEVQGQSPRGSLKNDDKYENDDAIVSSSSSRYLTSQASFQAVGQKRVKEMDPPLESTNEKIITVNVDDSDDDSKDDAILSQQIFATSGTSARVQSSITNIQNEKGILPQNSSRTVSIMNNVSTVIESRNTRVQSLACHDLNSAIATDNRSPLAPSTRTTQCPTVETPHAATVEFDRFDLMSPIASIGRPSVGSALSSSSYRKVKVPTPAIPVANEIGGKLYPDLRNHFIKELIRNAKIMRRAVYQKGSLDGSIRAINALALYPFPIRTAEGAQAIKSIGGELIAVLKESQKSIKKNEVPYNPPQGKFASATAAALVILLDHEAGKNGDDRHLSMEDLMSRINHKAHCTTGGRLFNRDTDYYLDKTNLDPSWMQIRKLCSTGLIKERKRKKACVSGFVYELSEEGRREARDSKARVSQASVPKGPLRQLAAHSVLEEFGNITVVMDFREGGGGRHKLHEMCGFMDDHEIPYVVRDLKISDYVFFIGDKLVPVLIERKSIEDVASSLHDGRWERQQRNMRKAQHVLGGGEERKCHICYLIEGDIDRTTVHGGFVGRSAYRKTVQDVKDAIASLPSLGFSVIESKNKYGSLEKIKRVAKEFLWRANNGSIDCTHTYGKFLDEVKHVSNTKGDPPTDPRHQNPAPPIVDEAPPPTGTHTVNSMNNNPEDSKEAIARQEELMKLSMKDLKDLCKERTDKMSGSKKDLVERLLQQRKPEVLISRARRNQYVPKVPSCNAAILIALHLHHEPGTPTLPKEKIMMYAEECGVNKDPMFGNGKGWYDGWSGIKDLSGGDPSLVSVVKRKYALTTQPRGSSGIDVATALHIVAHRQRICRCGRFVDTS